MAVELKVPAAGESITEVVVVEWLKGEGAFAKKDEPVALIETDKANVEVMAPADGIVQRVLKPAGEKARVGEVIAIFEPGGAPARTEPARAEPAPAPKPTGNVVVAVPQTVPRVESPRRAGSETLRGDAPAIGQRQAPAAITQSDRPREEGLQAPGSRLQASEPESRLSPSQRRAVREGNGNGHAVVARAPVKAPAPPRELREGERSVPMTPLRKRLAERLLEAQQNAALLTTFNEIDMSAVMALRKQYGEAFKEKHGVKLGFMSFFVRAVIDALKAFPAINAEIHNEDIIYKDNADIGVAVGGGKGLVVPIIRNAAAKSFAELEKTIADFAERAKAGRLKVEELQSGSFTISNGGIYGSLMSTPIVNPPQSGILGMHAIQDRPVARNGAVVIAPMMYVALTYDHRIVDGREAVGFLVRVKEGIENPARLLLEV